MPTIEQIRAARALIGWSQGELADQSGLSQTGIARIENGTNHPNSSTIEKITKAFDAVDVEFIGDSGVKKRTNEIKVFRGKSGLIQFMDDVYKNASTVGGKMSFYNVKPGNWTDVLGHEWWNAHVERMAKHKDKTEVRILIPEGNVNFISSAYGATYKWFPSNFDLSNKKTMYIYGGKLAFVTFLDSSEQVEILLLNNQEFANGVEALFDIAWNNVSKATV